MTGRMMSGLTVATALTIFFVRALYAAWFKVQRAVAPESVLVRAGGGGMKRP
jgi:multidrug efflux pump